MKDVDQVIKGLHNCKNGCTYLWDRCYGDCPYSGSGVRCKESVQKDAIETISALKAQIVYQKSIIQTQEA